MEITLIIFGIVIVLLVYMCNWLTKSHYETIVEYRKYIDYIDNSRNDFLKYTLEKATENDIIRRIEEWRTTFNLPVRREITIPAEEEITLSLSLIQEELNELIEASNNKDVVEVADAIGDLFVVVTQAANIWGIPIRQVVKEVCESNMSKVCLTEEEANNRKDCYYRNTALPNGEEVFILFRNSDHKVQKSSTFKEPDLKTVLGL